MISAAQNRRIGSHRPPLDLEQDVNSTRGPGSCAKYVGRVGALAVALGVGFAIASSGSGVAQAETDSSASDSAGTTKSSSSSPGKTSSPSADNDDDAGESNGAEDSADSEDDDADDIEDHVDIEDDEDDDSTPADDEIDTDTDSSDVVEDETIDLDQVVAEDDSNEVEAIDDAAPSADQSQSQTPEQGAPEPAAAPTVETATPETVATTVAVKSSTSLATLDAPETPAAPTLWTLLGQLISDIQRTWFNRRPDLDYQRVDVTLDNVGDISDPIAFGGTDPDGDELTYWTPRSGGLFGPRHGTVTIDQATGTFTYNADDAFAVTGGRDTFLVRVTDFNGEFHLHTLFGGHADYALVTVVVAPTNRAPVAGNDSVSVDEDGLLNVNPADLLANDTDADGDPLTIEGYTQPEHGDLWINRDGTISYNPDDDYHGTDTFTYTVTDGTQTTTATVTVNVISVNDAPVAGDDAIKVDEDGFVIVDPGQLLGNDSDADGDTLTIEGYTQPEHGDLWINRDGSLSYDPDDDYHGIDTFTYTVTDGTQTTTATVTVNVAAVQDAPVANDDSVNVDEDGLLNVNPADLLANDTDADGDPLTIEGYTQPEHGDLWINRDGTISYNPDDDYHGTDTFTYTVTDGTQTTTATVTVNVKPINDAPVAGDDTVSVDEDGLLNVNPADLLANDTDADGDPLTIEGYTQPEHGDLWINRDGSISYNPDGDYHGTDTFTYTVTDGTQTVTATVTVNVISVPDRPVAVNDALPATEDQPLTFIPISLLGNDTGADGAPLDANGDGVPDNPNVTIDSFTQPSSGALVQNPNGTFTYTPVGDFNGVVTFTYTIIEGGVASVPATVAINVAPVADAPGEPTVDVGEPNPLNGVVVGSVVGTDPDGDTITYSAPTRTAHGTVEIDPVTGAFTYTPDEDVREALGGGVSAGTVTLSDPAAVTQGTFDAWGGTSVGNFRYIATFFTATESREYIFGQSSAPVDTMMFLYNGTFDPTSPLTNQLDFNDDTWLDDHIAAGAPGASCGGSAGLCPQVRTNLVAGQLVTIVVTTYRSNDPLGLPQAFYTSGPGRFTTISPEDSFVVTMSDGNGGTTDVTVRVPILPLDSAIEA